MSIPQHARDRIAAVHAELSRVPERRVALVKPGDLLLIGNVGVLADVDLEAFGRFCGEIHRALGIRVAVFEQDIDLDLLPGGASLIPEDAADGSGG